MLHAYIYPLKIKKERVSGTGSNASITVEAAVSVPIFLFAVICLIYLLEVLSIREKIVFAARDAAKQAAEDVALFPALNPIEIENNIVKSLGADRMERSVLKGGKNGIHCGKSYFSYLTDEVHIVAEYSIRLPFPGFINLNSDFREEVKVRGWTGFHSKSEDAQGERIVYITKDSMVYHEDCNCTYLKLSIRFVPAGQLKYIRNIYGRKYQKCEKCVHGEPLGGVYVTQSGGKYHSSLNCSGLKRTVYAVKKSQVGLRRGCSRCSQ